MINAHAEKLLTPAEAAAQEVFRRFGRRPHLSTIYRWMSRGARNLSGQRVRLESLKTPGGRVTSQEAIARFIFALNDTTSVAQIMNRDGETARALRELAADGIGDPDFPSPDIQPLCVRHMTSHDKRRGNTDAK